MSGVADGPAGASGKPIEKDDPWGGNPPPLSLKNFGALAAMFLVVMGLLAMVVHPWVVAVDEGMRREREGRGKETAGRIALPGSEPVWTRKAVVSLGDCLDQVLNEADHALLEIIAPGVFTMGRDAGPMLERPAHEVELDGFAINVFTVRVVDYARFLAATKDPGASDAHRHPDEPVGKSRVPDAWDEQTTGRTETDVTGIDWFDAYAYASWALMRLPTEAEWERARTAQRIVVTDKWEWCYDGFDPGYYARAPRKNPLGPTVAYDRVVRRWDDDRDSGEPSRHKRSPLMRARDLSFRCAGTYAR